MNLNNEYKLNIDEIWNDYLYNGEINNSKDKNHVDNKNLVNNNKVDNKNEENNTAKVSEIYISTKTKIAYLSDNIDLENVFWKLNIINRDSVFEGITKKEMKFNTFDKDILNELIEKSKNIKNIKHHIIKKHDNPNNKLKFKDIRKITIGLSNKDLLDKKCKIKSAFYNCFVIIIRINFEDLFREIHVKVFNTGKLEIPGIKNDKLLIKTLNILVDNLKKITDNNSLSVNFNKIETVLINSNFTCGFYINREIFVNILKYKYKINCLFDSCQYPGIQCKYHINFEDKEYTLSFMIFRTGSILIVGKCTEDILYITYEYIKNILISEYNNIKISNNDNLNYKLNKNNSKILLKKKIILKNS